MVNLFTAYKPLIQTLLKFLGLSPQKLEIEPGTVMNIWSPTKKHPTKPAVLFLHGFTADGMFMWQFQAITLSRQYSIYIPDLIFFGDSTTTTSRRTLAFQADCVVEALKKLDARLPLTVVGLSYGGMIGFELARTRPDVVAALVSTSSVMTLTESLTEECLSRMGGGFHGWSDLLLPQSTQGVRLLFEFGTYELPGWIPDWIFRQFLQVMFHNRKEKQELLEALVIPDDQDPNKIPSLTQKFIPSEFGSDPDKVHIREMDYGFYARKAEIRRLVVAEGIPYTIISCNFFMSYLLPSLVQPGLDAPPRDEVSIFGDGNVGGVFLEEKDVAAFTIRAVDDPRTLHRVLYLRPPGNVFSLNELVGIWETKIGKSVKKNFVSEEELLRRIRETKYPDNMPFIFIYSTFIKGDQTYFDIETSGGIDGTKLYPDMTYTTISEYLDALV